MTYLRCNSNFKYVNVAEYTELSYLDCRSNRITALDLSLNVNLVTIKCGGNRELTSLIISDSCKTTLERMEMAGSRKITALDLSNFTALTYLDCLGSSLLAALDVSGCTSLETLRCLSCRISYLNVTGCTALTDLPFTVFHTPGHSPGSVCFYLPEDDVLFSGDTLFQGAVGRTDFPGGSMDLLVRSIRTQLYTLPDAIRVYPGHGEETTLGVEKLTNPFVRP